jgi:thiamine biosynthesis lipoprotein
MKSVATLTPIVSLAALVSCVAARPDSRLERLSADHGAMGTRVRIVLYAADRDAGDAAIAAAFARIDQLEAVASDWRDDSEVGRLARLAAARAPTGPVAVSDDLARLLVASQEVARRSGGAFDVTVGPLVQLWRRAKRRDAMPSDAELAAARAATGFQKLKVVTSTPPDANGTAHGATTVEFTVPGMRLDFGGVAKGDAAQAALDVLAESGFERALVANGGDVVAGAPPPGESGWLVAIADLEDDADDATPRHAIRLAHGAVSTSGDTVRFVELGGRRFSHVVDPRTGLGLEERRLVTVVARDGTTADALATAIDVLGARRGLELVETFDGAAARVTTFESGRALSCQSSRWPSMMLAPTDLR